MRTRTKKTLGIVVAAFTAVTVVALALIGCSGAPEPEGGGASQPQGSSVSFVESWGLDLPEGVILDAGMVDGTHAVLVKDFPGLGRAGISFTKDGAEVDAAEALGVGFFDEYDLVFASYMVGYFADEGGFSCMARTGDGRGAAVFWREYASDFYGVACAVGGGSTVCKVKKGSFNGDPEVMLVGAVACAAPEGDSAVDLSRLGDGALAGGRVSVREGDEDGRAVFEGALDGGACAEVGSLASGLYSVRAEGGSRSWSGSALLVDGLPGGAALEFRS